MKRINRKLVIGISLAALCIFAAGCENKDDTVSMFDLRTAMEEADNTIKEMSSADSNQDDAEDLFTYVSDMDYDKIDKYFISYAKEGTAEEIVVIAVKDVKDVDEAEESLQAHVEDRIKVFKEYAPEQVKMAEDALIFKRGKYAVLIISKEENKVRKAFEDFIEK